MTAINKVLAIAEAELGYLEKKSPAFLYDKTANAGYGNYTKYWQDILPSFQGQPWCAGFVTWTLVQAFGIELTRRLLRLYPYTYVPTLASLFTKYANPKRGDVVCFWSKSQKEFSHTGWVTKVSGDYFETIEGNTSGASGIVANGGGVCRKSYYNSQLPGTKFIRLDWSLVKEDLDAMTEAEKIKFNTLVEIVENLTKKVDELSAQNKIYHYMKDLPDWARPTIEDLYNRGLYQGNGPEDLNLPEQLMRSLVVQQRVLQK